MQIISASRRTDIPAFYSEEFLKLLKKGSFIWKNPFNKNQIKEISLQSKDILGIVFWSKHPQKIEPLLHYLQEQNIPYYFQYTLNNYPSYLEPSLPPLKERIDNFRRLALKTQAQNIIWRYDPIIISNKTSGNFHLEQIDFLAEQLKNSFRHLSVSFIHYYRKTKYKLKNLKTNQKIEFYDALDLKYATQLSKFIEKLLQVGKKHNIDIVSCAIPKEQGLKPGKCVDASFFGAQIKTDKNQRANCNCDKSIDVGSYNTCKWGCLYCYACK